MQLHLFPIYQLLWLFFIYAFLGWCTEVAYAALNTGKLVNRGFLNGPLCAPFTAAAWRRCSLCCCRCRTTC